MNNEPVDHHYNPCFWAAHWNFGYLEALRDNKPTNGRARDQKVHVWKLKQDKIIPLKTADCFIEKNANRTTIYHDQVLAYIQSLSPVREIQNIGIDGDSTKVSFNIENLFTTLEDTYQPYLIKTIKTGEIPDIQTKTMLAFFVFSQSIRNPTTWNFLKQAYQDASPGIDEDQAAFNLFIKFREAIEDRGKLVQSLAPFLFCKWVMIKTEKYLFPLADHPLLFFNDKVSLPLSPDLLLEIHIRTKDDLTGELCAYQNKLGYKRYKKFKQATLDQAKVEMVFGSPDFFLKNRFRYLINLFDRSDR